MTGFEKLKAIRDAIGDQALLNEMMSIMTFDQMGELADDLVHNLDLDEDDIYNN